MKPLVCSLCEKPIAHAYEAVDLFVLEPAAGPNTNNARFGQVKSERLLICRSHWATMKAVVSGNTNKNPLMKLFEGLDG